MTEDPQNPFRTPEGYFDSLEERIMARVTEQKDEGKPSIKVVRILKPVLGLVASFAIAYLILYYPIHHFSSKNYMSEGMDIESAEEEYITDYTSMDDNSIYLALTIDTDQDEATIYNDEFIGYLASELTDLDVYSEIQN